MDFPVSGLLVTIPGELIPKQKPRRFVPGLYKTEVSDRVVISHGYQKLISSDIGFKVLDIRFSVVS